MSFKGEVDRSYLNICIVVGISKFQQIDGEAFLLLTQADIVKVMNIKLGPAIKIYNSILMIKNNVVV